ncbi:MAG: DUF2064 domain-containing protein [Acidobacteria bacterium]|nr:DUF2064 domain-containing protein [Acidobacteriota bacterium]MYD70369.1 DUF2064 domain-containing protein [Acidobacteriota bacterium]MYJ04233.1 DUF2064 domain-containing protein [Acidobacteriota bacterium]
MTPPAPAAAPRYRMVVGLLTAAGGLALFWYFVRQAGVADIAAGVRNLGWAFGLVLLLSGMRFAVRSIAWIRCMPPGHGLRLRDVLPAFIAGDAVGNLAPFGVVVGEPAKSACLADRAPINRTFPALAVETLFYTLSIVVLLIAGAAALLLIVRPPESDWRAGVAVVGLLTAGVAAAHWILWRRIPVASATLSLLRLDAGTGALGRLARRVKRLESHLHRDYPRDWRRVLLLGGLEVTFPLLSMVEVWVVLSIIGGRPPTLVEAFVFEAANRFVNVVFKFVPLRFGVDEAGTGMLAELLAFGTAAGVTLAIVRKGRMLVWAAVGVAFLVRRGLSIAQLGAVATRGRDSVAVAIMARSPEGPRAPKGRLRDVVPDEADRRRLYAAFLADTVAACRTLDGVSLWVAYAPEGGRDGFAAAGIDDAELIAQRGDDLGGRERALFNDLFAEGFGSVVVIGSDLPTLPASHVADAARMLRDTPAVLGRAEDGGYYLIGLAAPPPGGDLPDLFTGVRWGTADAFEDTLRAAETARVAMDQVAPWYDVDDAAGLARLKRDLEGDASAPATAAALSALRRAGG